MTKTASERLAVVEEQVKDVREDVHEVKLDIREIKRLLEKQDRRFVLRREATAITATLTLLIAIIGAYVATKGL